MTVIKEKRQLLSSAARIQVPWIKVTIGSYTFGVYSRSQSTQMDKNGIYFSQNTVQYPNYIQSLDITKVNGQVNQYTLSLTYPVTQHDDPNFFEKVLSSVSKTRKIIFSYGDMSMPAYIYKDEEALITSVKSNFNLSGGGAISYTISAVSSAALNSSGSWTFPGGVKKPSTEIRKLLQNRKYGLQELFPGMYSGNTVNTLNSLIASDDKYVDLVSKVNISAIDYISYLVSCMVPNGYNAASNANTAVYMLTLHDDTSYESTYYNTYDITGAYFTVEKVSHKTEQSDAYEIDIGFGNTGTIVTAFQVTDDENYALLYDYNLTQETEHYVRRVDNNGNLVDIYCPSVMSKNDEHIVRPNDVTWWTKMTQYPIKATITIQGLLRPAILMTYVRLNVIYPGGNKHVSSGLYLVTSQKDRIDGSSGYKTTLGLTKISGDNSLVANSK